MSDEGFTRSDGWRLFLGVAWLVIFVLRPQWVAAITLALIGGGFIAYNAMIFWSTVIRDGTAPSVLPIFGGIIAAAGIVLLPVTGSWQWSWIPLLIDWGGLPMFMYAAWEARRRRGGGRS